MTTDCIEWQGNVNPTTGYGRGSESGLRFDAHRKAYEDAHGPIPPGLVIDHLCRNTLCVNPAHLEAVTQRENVLRGRTIPAANVEKTHCPVGHPYDAANTYVLGRRRSCRKCHAAVERARRRSA